MNASLPGSRPRQSHDGAAFTPVSLAKSVTKRSDALPVISGIVAVFVLLAVLIVLAVHFGPRLRTLRIALYSQPVPPRPASVLLTRWSQLGSVPAMDSAGVTCSCSHHLPLGSAEPNVIEITYL